MLRGQEKKRWERNTGEMRKEGKGMEEWGL
jgi:hypothetical protein